MRPRYLPLAGALLLALVGSASQAASPVHLSGAVTSTVPKSCVIKSADDINFGAYSPISGNPGQASGVVKVRCTKGAAVSLAATTGGSAMVGPGGNLAYALYIDAGYSKQWGASATAFVPVSPLSPSTHLYFSSVISGLSAAQCRNVAISSGYASLYGGTPTGTSGVCYTNSTPPASTMNYNFTGSTTYYISDASTGTTLRPGTAGSTYNLPPGYTTTGSFTYSIPNGPSSQLNLLTGTSTTGLSDLPFTYYAKVPASQNLPAGSYMDTVIIQATF